MLRRSIDAFRFFFINNNIESNLDRSGLLSPTHDQRSQQHSGHIMLQSFFIDKPKFLEASRHAKIRKVVVPRSMAVEASTC